MFLSVFSILVAFLSSSVQAYVGGIPVPGRTVPVLRLFEHYAHSCSPSSRKNFGFEQISEILQSLNGEEVALKVYNSLFFSIADVDVQKLMGKWFTVVDAPGVHKERCTVSFCEFFLMKTEVLVEMLARGPYTASFSIVQYSRSGDEVVTNEGFGSVTGPDPGEVLLNTGNEADPCPYFPVAVGPDTPDGKYSYVILSQPLKHPTMVLARSPESFRKYTNEVLLAVPKESLQVRTFLEKHGFLAPLASFNKPLQFVNSTACRAAGLYYEDI